MLRGSRTPGSLTPFVRRALAAVGAASVATCVLAGCAGSATPVVTTPTSSADTADLPLVYGAFTTALEEPWDSAIHAALESAEADGLIRYEHADQLGATNEMGGALREIIASSQPDIIMGDAFAAEEAVRAVASEFPDIAFAFGSAGSEQAPNFSVFDNWMQDPAYLAGMLAGGLTQTSTIAIIAAMPIPEVNRIVNAFIAGAQQTGPTATVEVSYIDSFYDPDAAKNAADAAIANGADVVFAERDGAIASAQEQGVPAFGMMIDQQADAPTMWSPRCCGTSNPPSRPWLPTSKRATSKPATSPSCPI